MKICDVVQFYSPLGGGVRRYLEDKVHFLAHEPSAEHVVIIPSANHAVTQRGKSKFYEIKSMRLIGSLSYRMLLNRKRILRIIAREKPHIIEVGDPYRSAWICLQASQRFQIPIVAFYHSDFPRALGRTIHRFLGHAIENHLASWVESYVVGLYNRMNATVVASHRLERVLRECGIDNVVRIPLGTDVHVFRPRPNTAWIRERLGLEPEDRLLLFVGRLAREKNIRSLFGMMNELAREPSTNGRCHLLLVGDGELRNLVESTIAQRRDITWYRYCESAETLAEYYTEADLFIHAGNFETFGITSLEAQACGTRVIAVRGGGLDDSVEGEDPFIMANSSSPADMAKAVRRALHVIDRDDKEKRQRRIHEQFSIQTTFTRLTLLYDHILQGRPLNDFRYDAMTGRDDGIYRKAVHAE